MAERIAFELNGEARTVEVAPDTPLLHVLRNEIQANSAPSSPPRAANSHSPSIAKSLPAHFA
jgi:aerobic-type carbon monoxide dehydrogenase small subunit (CoxS/CutS family)